MLHSVAFQGVACVVEWIPGATPTLAQLALALPRADLFRAFQAESFPASTASSVDNDSQVPLVTKSGREAFLKKDSRPLFCSHWIVSQEKQR